LAKALVLMLWEAECLIHSPQVLVLALAMVQVLKALEPLGRLQRLQRRLLMSGLEVRGPQHRAQPQVLLPPLARMICSPLVGLKTIQPS
jgi:hypothetical protein